MMTLQGPGVASREQPSGMNMPFGYPSDALFPDAPPEPSGNPILTPNDSHFLASFFGNFVDNTSDVDPGYAEGLNFRDDWMGLPPTLVGSTTSFGSLPVSLHPDVSTFQQASFAGLMGPSSMMAPPPPPPPPPPPSALPLDHQPSAEVLAAATTLLQQCPPPQMNGSSHVQPFGRDMGALPLGLPGGHLRHQPMADFRLEERRISNAQMAAAHDHTFADMVFGPGSQQVAPRGNMPEDVRWGSDKRFGKGERYLPQSDKESTENLERKRMKYMECLEPSQSADTTQPSSPVFEGDPSPFQVRTSAPNDHANPHEEPDAPPRKRRKSRPKVDADEHEDFPAPVLKKAPAKRKSKAESVSVDPPTEGPSKRRRSAASGSSKPTRENLSEEQKRENHIKSEQKRRTLIKDGYDGVCDLVPGLKGGGFSRSAVLSTAASWLDKIIQDNERLRNQLNEL